MANTASLILFFIFSLSLFLELVFDFFVITGNLLTSEFKLINLTLKWLVGYFLMTSVKSFMADAPGAMEYAHRIARQH
jgi:hypothetical protein